MAQTPRFSKIAPAELAGEPYIGSHEIAWQLLRWLNVSRAVLAGLLMTLFFSASLPGGLGGNAPALFIWMAIVYFGFSVFVSMAVRQRQPGIFSQSTIQFGGDIAAIAVLMYASGGVGSGLGTLLLVPVAVAALIFSIRLAFAFAAIATIAVLAQETLVAVVTAAGAGGYVQAGLLGVVIFGIATLANSLAQRLRESELLTAQRGFDLANLATLNDYIIQHLRSGVVVIDGDDNIRLKNPAAATALSLVGTVDGETPLAVAAPRLKGLLDNWRQTPSDQSDTPLTTPSDTVLVPHFNQLGQAPSDGTLIFLEDASDAAEQVRQMKLAGLGRLTASIAHEIRNPLGAIGHANQLMGESDNLSDEDRRLVDIIDRHTSRVNGIVENVLQLSRGGTPVKIEDVGLEEWLRRFAAEFRERHALDRDDLRITVHQGRSPLRARIDISQLRQVVDNLAENALRYGMPDSVAHYGDHSLLEFRLGLRPFRSEPSLEVLDRGAGIPADIAEQIFEPFYTSGGRGTGLGLFIARELCECNNATLTYHARGGGGSCFRIIFADAKRWIA